MQNKIAIIDHVGCKAGSNQYTTALGTALASEGLEVYVCSNFKVEHSPVHWKKYFLGNEGNKYRRALNFFTGFLRSGVWCRLQGCDRVILHLFSFALKDLIVFALLRILGLKITSIVHDVEGFSGAGTSRLIQRMMLKHLSKWVVVHNLFSLQHLSKVAGPEIASNAVIIRHGHFHHLFNQMPAKAAARALLGLDNNITYLLFFGQIKEEKGLDILIRALTLLPQNVSLIIAGRPWKTTFAPYESLIQREGTEQRIVKMIQFVTDKERELLFAAADLLVIPYRVIYQSGVLLMAISAHIPVVVSDLPANCEIIEDRRNGFVFASGNHEALITALQRALSDNSKLEALASEAYNNLSKTHDWQGIAKQYVKMWSDKTLQNPA